MDYYNNHSSYLEIQSHWSELDVFQPMQTLSDVFVDIASLVFIDIPPRYLSIYRMHHIRLHRYLV